MGSADRMSTCWPCVRTGPTPDGRQVLRPHPLGQHEGDDRVGALRPDQVRRGVEGNEAPGLHDRHPVGQVLGLLHVVGGEQDRGAQLAQRGDQVPCPPPGGRIEPRRRLVEEQQLRVADQAEGEIEPPTLATGQGLGPGPCLVGEPHVLDDLIDVAVPRVQPGVEHHQLADTELLVEPGVLEHDPDPSRGRRVPPVAGSTPRTLTVPDVRFRWPSRISTVVVLPAPFGPEQGEHLAGLDREAQVIDRPLLAVVLAQAPHHHDRPGSVRTVHTPFTTPRTAPSARAEGPRPPPRARPRVQSGLVPVPDRV